jgi:RNA polymerase sigma factor (sigma-70 family)
METNPINLNYARLKNAQPHEREAVLNTLYKHLRDQAEAAIFKVLRENSKELAAEAAETAIMRMADFRSGSGFSTWAYRIAINIARDEQRKRQLRNEIPLVEEAHLTELPPESEEVVMARMKRLLNSEECILYELLIANAETQDIADFFNVHRITIWRRIKALKKKLVRITNG